MTRDDGGAAPVGAEVAGVVGDDEAVVASWAEHVGARPAGADALVLPGGRRLRLRRDETADFRYSVATRRLSSEVYELVADTADTAGGGDDAVEPSAGAVTLVHSGRRALRFGLAEVARRARADDFAGLGRQEPRFAVRGVIEGYYGPPWTAAQRRDMVELIAATRMNTFLVSPKDDPALREAWAEPFGPAALDEWRELGAYARALDVDLYVAVSPGLTMRYSSDTDVAALVAKLRQLLDVGVSGVALLLDDIPPRLQHPADRSRFASLAQAHAAVVSRVREQLRRHGPTAPFLVCPTVYWGTGEEPYVLELAAGVPADVPLLWTGRAICSPAIDLLEAATFLRATARPPLYWDNYPVNDVSMRAELHVGAYRGRDRHLYRGCDGVLANAMELAAASRIPLRTIADYLWDPERYDADRSWWQAIVAEVGDELAADFRDFADAVRTSCLDAEDPRELYRALEEVEFDLSQGDVATAASRLGQVATRARDGAARLAAPGALPARLAADVQPWLERYAAAADTLSTAADLLDQPGTDPARWAVVTAAARTLAADPLATFGGALAGFVDRLAARPGGGGVAAAPGPTGKAT